MRLQTMWPAHFLEHSRQWETFGITGASAQIWPCWAPHLQGEQGGDIPPKSYPHPPSWESLAGV